MVPPPDGVHAVAEELDRLAQPFPGAAGGGYWDTGRRSYVYRVVPDAPGSRELRDTIQRALIAAAPLPAPFLIEEGRVSTRDLITATDRLNADFGWAGPFEHEVHRVLADRLRGLLRVDVRAHPDEIAQLAAERAGIDAYAKVSAQGGQPQ